MSRRFKKSPFLSYKAVIYNGHLKHKCMLLNINSEEHLVTKEQK